MNEDGMSGWALSVPTGSKLDEQTRPANWVGDLDSAARATEERLEVARRHFGAEARLADFDLVGRRWVNRASGAEYREAADPLLLADPSASSVTTFFVDGVGNIRWLRPRGSDAARVVETVTIGAVPEGRRADPGETMGKRPRSRPGDPRIF